MSSRDGWIAAFKRDWRSAARSFAHVLDHRISNRLQDRNAVLAGACNSSTWSESLHSFRGGYAHWRCAKEAGHSGWHRSNNYRWPNDDHGRALYDPIPIRHLNQDDTDVIPFQKYAEGRHLTPTSRQDRLMTRFAEANLILNRQRRLAEEDREAKYGKRNVNDNTDDL